MSTSRIRGWAGLLFGALGLLLARSGPGFAVMASAAPGCPDNPSCYAEVSEEGWAGPTGGGVTSRTGRCVGPCDGIAECQPINGPNTDGSTTFQCSCDPNQSPAACSGFTTVKADGQVSRFVCLGSCDPGDTSCKPKNYDITTTPRCPVVYSLKTKCVCE